MKKKLMLVVSIIAVFIAGAIMGNVFQVKDAEAKKYRTLVEWEKIGKYTKRSKVPGGWLVNRWGKSVNGLTFVPDPGYKWQ